MKKIEQHQSFGGEQQVWTHFAQSLQCDMKVAVFLPPNPENRPLGVIYWLSGLTCTEQNFITKSGFQRYAAEHQVIVVAPDTSPRGEEVPDDAAYDLGQGAGFYLNATQSPWNTHYRMYDYILNELPSLIEQHFATNGKRAIMGHSMGGHGALVLALRNPDRYQSVSAFSPILAPSLVPWGEKAFSAYLGEDRKKWQQYDANSLIKQGFKLKEIRIDQGLDDEFLATQLRTEEFIETCRKANQPVDVRFHKGYDHSYYFIASFIGEHIVYHAQCLAD
ncbi:S-formylglutathione hydrolase [Aggregatibacter actinomycetemcomitans serotype e str. SC936]|uniref:S-formylglutathione hydrolase n=1 Tax=Aggregatibacter actinomycetemcomitans TaxID=714 RepID=UPI00077EB3A9|nr:S-formylglutathione hydrolase [Aggregatibacter actinomycetemcomitans]KYK76175.1 S-formylglutathione hydrolase [Aggregatibacter actinomycetemcomitans serotype e str. SA3096]KYK79321.1 S-formylglutathione hydrolase [Aggregatibacter actinomycetemcomitans serotype e str. SC936]KYK94966.1 S-formylglutathione hydrolase [Aggregatibacter actinomycetemcomitans serotype e str. ANH9776]TYB21048.1 S-formylglutathione hydrolase [Aggregatibacter actinomycetemcomitans]